VELAKLKVLSLLLTLPSHCFSFEDFPKKTFIEIIERTKIRFVWDEMKNKRKRKTLIPWEMLLHLLSVLLLLTFFVASDN
jgi:hypothetical protein